MFIKFCTVLSTYDFANFISLFTKPFSGKNLIFFFTHVLIKFMF